MTISTEHAAKTEGFLELFNKRGAIDRRGGDIKVAISSDDHLTCREFGALAIASLFRHFPELNSADFAYRFDTFNGQVMAGFVLDSPKLVRGQDFYVRYGKMRDELDSALATGLALRSCTVKIERKRQPK